MTLLDPPRNLRFSAPGTSMTPLVSPNLSWNVSELITDYLHSLMGFDEVTLHSLMDFEEVTLHPLMGFGRWRTRVCRSLKLGPVPKKKMKWKIQKYKIYWNLDSKGFKSDRKLHFRGKFDKKSLQNVSCRWLAVPPFRRVMYATAFQSNRDQLNSVNPNLTIYINR